MGRAWVGFGLWARPSTSLAAEDTATANFEPVLTYEHDGAPMLPVIEPTAHSQDIIIGLLKGFLIAAWSAS